MMIVNGLVIYPLIIFLPDLFEPYTQPLPKSLGQLAVMVVMMPLATYVAIPVVTHVFKQWLHKP